MVYTDDGKKAEVTYPNEDPDVVLDCFTMIKYGPSLKTLKRRRGKKLFRLNSLIRQIKHMGEVVAETESSEDFTVLQQLQESLRRTKLRLGELEGEIENYGQQEYSAADELALIAALPQVIGIRANTPDILVVTVVASIKVSSRAYHLGTWDIFFGKLDEARHLGVKLSAGSGDASHYRIRRTVGVETRIEDGVWTEYHNYKDGSFCFGNNKSRVNELATKREYLHCVQLMINYMSWISETRRDKVPKLFQPLEERAFRR